MAGLSTPLHLAASLLALYAAVGLACVIVARPGLGRSGSRSERRLDLVVAAGAIAIAVGHGLAGALVAGSRDIVAVLHAGGLVLVAVGIAPQRLRHLAGTAVLVPVPVLPQVAALGAAAGLVAGIRAARSGRALLVGAGMAAWGLAEPLERISAVLGASLTLTGAGLIGCWLWIACARALLARFVTAAVVLLLGVVVVVAAVVSGLGSRDLVADELQRLSGLSEGAAADLQRDWPSDARNAVAILAGSGRTLLDAAATGGLGPLYDSLLRGLDQEFLLVLGPGGEVAGVHDPDGSLARSVAARLSMEPFVDKILSAQSATEAELLVVNGELLAIGATRLDAEGAGGRPVGVAVSGRRADRTWAAQARRRLGAGIVIVVGGRPSVASQGVAPFAWQVAEAVDGPDRAVAMRLPGRPVYAAAADISAGDFGDRIAQVVTLSPAGGLTRVQEDQARLLFLLALAGALVAAGVAGVVTGRLVAPIRRLTVAAAAVREGDLDVSVAVAGTDEVGELGRTFGEMTTSLSAQAAQLRDAAGIQARLRARLEALTGSMSDALIAVNPQGRVVTFNPAAQRLVGKPDAEVLGLPLDEVLLSASPRVRATEVLGEATSEETCAVSLLLRRADGGVVPIAATAAPVHDSAGGAVLGRVLVLRDVSREHEIDRMKTELLANVSHELRTPLTPIRGYAEVLARREIGPEAAQRFAQQILSSTARLERIVGMIVDYAGLDSGSLLPHSEPVALPELVGERLTHWRRELPDREFHPQLAGDLPPVEVDRTMLRRCLDELLDNAVKFSPGGEPVDVVAVCERNGSGARVRLSVRDRGVGIDAEHLDHVFGDFYQAGAGETRRFGGLGLGLALVRRIVEELGGDVAVDSAAGQGSTFSLLLPVSGAAGGQARTARAGSRTAPA